MLSPPPTDRSNSSYRESRAAYFTGRFAYPEVGICRLDAGLAEADMSIAAAGLEEDALREAERCKTVGNSHFTSGESIAAVQAYMQAQGWLARMGYLDPDIDREAEGAIRLESRLAPLAANLHANIAAVKLKLGEYSEAIQASQAAQRSEPRMVKACFREAKAWTALGQLEEAERTIARGLRWVEGGTAEEKNFKIELKRVKGLQKAKKDKHREAFSEAYGKKMKQEAEEEAAVMAAETSARRTQKKEIWPELAASPSGGREDGSGGGGKTRRFNAANIATVE